MYLQIQFICYDKWLSQSIRLQCARYLLFMGSVELQQQQQKKNDIRICGLNISLKMIKYTLITS